MQIVFSIAVIFNLRLCFNTKSWNMSTNVQFQKWAYSQISLYLMSVSFWYFLLSNSCIHLKCCFEITCHYIESYAVMIEMSFRKNGKAFSRGSIIDRYGHIHVSNCSWVINILSLAVEWAKASAKWQCIQRFNKMKRVILHHLSSSGCNTRTLQ